MKTKKMYVQIIFVGTIIVFVLACGLLSPSATPVSSPTSTLENTVDDSAMNLTGNDGATLAYVPKGDFTMGGSADNAFAECQKIRSDCKRDWFIREEPIHIVSLDAFWIDQTETTNAMYAKCVDAGICKKPMDISGATSYYGSADFDNYPIVNVDWDMARNYCAWAGRRLPTEAEWEKAARGTDARVYPWGNDEPNANLLNYNSHIGELIKVGIYEEGKSIYGAYDMVGNVVEWVNDWYGETYYQNSPASNPLGPDMGDSHVLRGGSWGDGFLSVRTTSRNHSTPTDSYLNVGFRCAISESQTMSGVVSPDDKNPNPDPSTNPNPNSGTDPNPDLGADSNPNNPSTNPDPSTNGNPDTNGGNRCAKGYFGTDCLLSIDTKIIRTIANPCTKCHIGDTTTAGALTSPLQGFCGEYGCVPFNPPDRCDLFDGRNIELTMLEWDPGTPLIFYLNMTGGVPGLEDKTFDDGNPWNYSVEIGEYATEGCTFIEGYRERLYCSIELPSDYSATLQPIALTVNDCETPIYKNSLASIPSFVSVDLGGGSDGEQSGGTGDGSSDPSCGVQPSDAGLSSWCSCMGGTLYDGKECFLP